MAVAMRIAELVRTYRHLNDPDAPSWSIRFTGALAALVLAAAGVAALALLRDEAAEPPALAATSEHEADGTRTDYVGYVVTATGPTAVDPERVAQALAQWEAQHPDARVLEKTPVTAGGVTVGWRIHYEP